jgi:hypothetical protein
MRPVTPLTCAVLLKTKPRVRRASAAKLTDDRSVPAARHVRTARLRRGVAGLTCGLTLCVAFSAACGRGSARSKPFAVIHVANRNHADAIVTDCEICMGPVRILGPRKELALDVADWKVNEPSSLVFHVRLGSHQIVCRPAQPISLTLPASRTYDLRYAVTPGGRCVVTRQTVTP